MKTRSWLRRFGAIVGTLSGLALVFVVGMRFTDGPIFVFPGGTFKSGELVSHESFGWADVAQIREIEFQLELTGRSRVTWFIVHEGTPYIPCGFCANTFLKRWPRQLEVDDRVVLRVDGRRIEGRAHRVEHASTEYLAVTETKRAKYSDTTSAYEQTENKAAGRLVGAIQFAEDLVAEPESDSERESWLYRIDPR